MTFSPDIGAEGRDRMQVKEKRVAQSDVATRFFWQRLRDTEFKPFLRSGREEGVVQQFVHRSP